MPTMSTLAQKDCKPTATADQVVEYDPPIPFSIFPVRHVDDSCTPDPPRRLQVCGEVKLVSHLSRCFCKSPLSTKT
jgi:hypothetical protein